MDEATTPRDIRGKTIKVGATVLYPIRRGSRMWQNIATVTVATPTRLLVNRSHPTPHENISLRSLAQIVVLEDAR